MYISVSVESSFLHVKLRTTRNILAFKEQYAIYISLCNNASCDSSICFIWISVIQNT